MGHHRAKLVILLCCYLLFVGLVQCTRSLSKDNNHLKLLNKPLTKTIQDKYGDIHDCVDVYKQVAFDHPLLHNHTIHFQTLSTLLRFKESGMDSSTISESFDQYLTSETCPIGTIPIRRISGMDRIVERQSTKVKRTETANRPNTYLAVTRTKAGPRKYSGAGGSIRLDNPKVVGQQFSTTRIRLQTGADSIEVGWRVDPSLYGDSRTRLFIRTDAGHTHCFNTRCPGFIQTYHGINLDVAFERISTPGEQVYAVPYQIVRDNKNGNWNFMMFPHPKDNENGNWSLMMFSHPTLIGYWPSHIFTGLAGFADRVEWGGAVYSPPGTSLPPMGSGNPPIDNPKWDGFISQMEVLNESGQTIDASDVETYADNSKMYSVHDVVYNLKDWRHTMYYGGSGHPKF